MKEFIIISLFLYSTGNLYMFAKVLEEHEVLLLLLIFIYLFVILGFFY